MPIHFLSHKLEKPELTFRSVPEGPGTSKGSGHVIHSLRESARIKKAVKMFQVNTI